MNEEIIEKLVKQYQWSVEQLRLGQREDFKCAYRDKDLLKDVDAFKEWTINHVVPNGTHPCATSVRQSRTSYSES